MPPISRTTATRHQPIDLTVVPDTRRDQGLTRGAVVVPAGHEVRDEFVRQTVDTTIRSTTFASPVDVSVGPNTLQNLAAALGGSLQLKNGYTIFDPVQKKQVEMGDLFSSATYHKGGWIELHEKEAAGHTAAGRTLRSIGEWLSPRSALKKVTQKVLGFNNPETFYPRALQNFVESLAREGAFVVNGRDTYNPRHFEFTTTTFGRNGVIKLNKDAQ